MQCRHRVGEGRRANGRQAAELLLKLAKKAVCASGVGYRAGGSTIRVDSTVVALITRSARYSDMKLRVIRPAPASSASVNASSTASRLATSRTNKNWVAFLAEKSPVVALSFLDGLSSIDARMRPQKTPTGDFTVSKKNAAELTSIIPRLDNLAKVVTKAIGAAESGSPE